MKCLILEYVYTYRMSAPTDIRGSFSRSKALLSVNKGIEIMPRVGEKYAAPCK